MKTLRPLFNLIMLIGFISLFSCGKDEYLKSEAGIKKQLKGTWDLIPIPRSNPAQNWAFSDDKLSRTESSISYVGDFSVNTSLTSVKIKLEHFTVISGQPDYNGNWDLVRLDNDFLVIATDKDGTTGLYELEFQKKK